MVRDEQVEAALSRLVAAGTLDEAQAAAVRTELAAGSTRPVRTEPGHVAPGVVVAAYIGVALVAAGVATLIVTNWQDLSTAGRLLIFIALTTGLVGLGAMLQDRLDVARGLAWVVAVPCAGGIGAAAASGADAKSEVAFLVAAAAAVACAAALLMFRRRLAQVVAFVAAWIVADVAIGLNADYDDTGIGAIFVGTGVLLVVAAVSARFPAPELLLGLGGLVALGGIHLLADEQLGLAAVLAAALCTFAYYRAATSEPAVPLVVATLTIASVTPRLAGSWFDDSVGASGILALTGLVVLLAVAVHVRLSRHQSRRRSSSR